VTVSPLLLRQRRRESEYDHWPARTKFRAVFFFHCLTLAMLGHSAKSGDSGDASHNRQRLPIFLDFVLAQWEV
jgi:hypothetical protein